MPVPLAAAVDAGVDRLADQHERHPEEHPEHPRGEDVADLPQLAAQAPALGLQRRPPDEHPGEDEARVLGERGRSRCARRPRTRTTGASRRAPARRRGSRRAGGAGRGSRRAGAAAGRAATSDRRAAGRTPAPGCAARPAAAARRGRRAAGARPCARSAGRRRASRCGESSAIACRPSPTCQQTICAARHAHAAAAEHAQRAHVERTRRRCSQIRIAIAPQCGASRSERANDEHDGHHDQRDGDHVEQEAERPASERSGFCTALEDVDGRVDDDPHHVDEVPVDARHLDAAVVLGREVAAEGADRDEQQQRQADEDVRAVQAGEAVEDRALGAVLRREADVDVLVDLDEQERAAEQERREDARPGGRAGCPSCGRARPSAA